MASGWTGLSQEVRCHILQILRLDGCKVSRLATVCREWQTELERYNFARIRVTPSRLVDFGSMIHRNRALVEYVWFCLELDEYGCTKCAPTGRTLTQDEYEEAFSINDAGGYPITTAFQDLFSVLSTWDLKDNLVLDISIYSPSDSKHWFPYLTFMPDIALDMLGDGMEQTIPNKVYNDPQHGWRAVRARMVRSVSTSPGDNHYTSPAVLLPEMEARFNKNLKRLVVFENFNQQYPVIMHQVLSGDVLSGCVSHRKPTPAVSRMVGLASLNLEYLAASFIVDASHFFDVEPSWEWPNIRSIVLTSSLLTPDQDPAKIEVMLQAAAAAAMKMPQLETIEIWNGRRGLAALFKYQVFRNKQEATITWRGTWQLTMETIFNRGLESRHRSLCRLQTQFRSGTSGRSCYQVSR
ncbi:hypothetical protein Z517_05403 [Fonsecaea pedrosoi CBS 271.37]|uniref:DUF6546 domain-containing protein n=1 Tax=Fonsecaea pedrosoi CBS 271.37 TaxID=1442368 RepID=A0A0D2DX26_9EURO|nr:uncharacterized protein Z517_05403 [Fonsecaea pedrosoi CBS 271.37]KIW82376.1 hypothetical protein Z517_05403 [Fonsecaea pedrosoi CBS 271.37]